MSRRPRLGFCRTCLGPGRNSFCSSIREQIGSARFDSLQVPTQMNHWMSERRQAGVQAEPGSLHRSAGAKIVPTGQGGGRTQSPMFSKTGCARRWEPARSMVLKGMHHAFSIRFKRVGCATSFCKSICFTFHRGPFMHYKRSQKEILVVSGTFQGKHKPDLQHPSRCKPGGIYVYII